MFRTGYESNDGGHDESDSMCEKQAADNQLEQKYKLLLGENRRQKRKYSELQKTLSQIEADLVKSQNVRDEAEKRASQLSKRQEKHNKSYQRHLADMESRSAQEIQRQKAEIDEFRERLQKKDKEALKLKQDLEKSYCEQIATLRKELQVMTDKYNESAQASANNEKKYTLAIEKLKDMEAAQSQVELMYGSLVELETRCLQQQHLISKLQAGSDELRMHQSSRPSLLMNLSNKSSSSSLLRSKLSRLGLLQAPSSTESFTSSYFGTEGLHQPISAHRQTFSARTRPIKHQRSKSEVLVTMADILNTDEMPHPFAQQSQYHFIIAICDRFPSLSDDGSAALLLQRQSTNPLLTESTKSAIKGP